MSKKDFNVTTIAKEVAIERLEAMLPRIVENVQLVMAIDGALSTGNEEIRKINAAQGQKKQWYGAHCYTTISNSLVVHLALTLSRLFDDGSKHHHPDDRDVISIPILIHHMKRNDVRSALVARARMWPVDASNLVDNAIGCVVSIFRDLSETSTGNTALELLKDFRDKRLAHTLSKDFAAPRFQDLEILREAAMEIASHASLVIEGTHWEPKDFLEERIRQGEAFWPAAIGAVLAAEEP